MSCTFGKFKASKFLNGCDVNLIDIKKAANIYQEFCEAKQDILKTPKRFRYLIFKDFKDRLDYREWDNPKIKSHLLNVLKSTFNDLNKKEVSEKSEFDTIDKITFIKNK